MDCRGGWRGYESFGEVVTGSRYALEWFPHSETTNLEGPSMADEPCHPCELPLKGWRCHDGRNQLGLFGVSR